jgi:hypothetical protein
MSEFFTKRFSRLNLKSTQSTRACCENALGIGGREGVFYVFRIGPFTGCAPSTSQYGVTSFLLAKSASTIASTMLLQPPVMSTALLEVFVVCSFLICPTWTSPAHTIRIASGRLQRWVRHSTRDLLRCDCVVQYIRTYGYQR